MTYTLEQAQSNLAQLLAEAEQGKEVLIERQGKPPIGLHIAHPPAVQAERVPGKYAGLVRYDDSAFDPLTDEELVEYGFGFMLDKKLVSDEERDQKAG